MSDVQTLAYLKAQSANRLRTYTLLFGVSIVIEALAGLYAILDPAGFVHFLILPDPYPSTWARLWGATLVALELLYIPGARHPLFYRWPNWASIAIKLFVAVLLLCANPAFYLIAGWELLWAVVLFLTYYQLALADLRTRP